MGQFNVYILTLGKHTYATTSQQRKRLITEGFQWGHAAGCDDMHGFGPAFPKYLHPFLVHNRPRPGHSDRFTQESCFFPITLNEMDPGPRLARERDW
jgi:hypothetical protein